LVKYIKYSTVGESKKWKKKLSPPAVNNGHSTDDGYIVKFKSLQGDLPFDETKKEQHHGGDFLPAMTLSHKVEETHLSIFGCFGKKSTCTLG
jgi:hypothetical protein